jgi:hypothetical protein
LSNYEINSLGRDKFFDWIPSSPEVELKKGVPEGYKGREEGSAEKPGKT